MELVILDDQMLEFSRFNTFDSLVWNERYQEPGDFQLRSYGVQNTLSILDEGMLVGVDKSDYVMQVTDIDTDVDSSGNEIVTVSGKTLEHIFAYRPAIPKISTTFAMDADDPDGWEFGFKDDEVASIDPFQHIIMQVIHHADHLHYQRAELKYLTLPFQYYWYANTVPPGWSNQISQSKLQRYYVVDRGATVADVLDEMLPEAEMGIATLRPRPESPFWATHQEAFASNPNRPGLVMFYRPRALSDRPTFDYLMEDYTSESIQKNFEYHDVLLLASEDEVQTYGPNTHSTSLTRTGIRSRVKLRERDKFNLSEHELENYSTDAGRDLFEGYLAANVYSIETSGKYPYDYKNYALAGGLSSFFLGDIVKLNLQREKEIDVQVKEFIRSQDADGYKEYPTFAPYTTLGHNQNKMFSQYRSMSGGYNWN